MSKPVYVRQPIGNEGINIRNRCRMLDRFLECDNVVLAGGSVALLFDKSAKYQPNDFDFFILNNDTSTLKRCLKLVQNAYTSTAYMAVKGQTVTLVSRDKDKNDTIPIQLILTKCKTVEELLSSFDFDYVQCALDKLGLIRSEWAIDAAKTKSIKYMFIQKRDSETKPKAFTKRVAKAVIKGYKFPIGTFGEFKLPLSSLQTVSITQYCEPYEIERVTFGNITNERNTWSAKFIDREIDEIMNAVAKGEGKYVDIESTTGLYREINPTTTKKSNEQKRDKQMNENELDHWCNNKEFSDYAIVSKDNKTFYVHRVILAVIPYFRTLFRGSNIENKTNTIKLDIDSSEVAMILRYVYGDKSVSEFTTKIEEVMSLIRNANYLSYCSLLKDAWDYLDGLIKRNTTNDHAVTLDDIKMLLTIAKEYEIDIPEALSIDAALESSEITADDALMLIRECRITTVEYVLKWIEAHPEDSVGHSTILKIVETHSGADFGDWYVSKVRTRPFVDFVFGLMMHKYGKTPKIDEKEEVSKVEKKGLSHRQLVEKLMQTKQQPDTNDLITKLPDSEDDSEGEVESDDE